MCHGRSESVSIMGIRYQCLCRVCAGMPGERGLGLVDHVPLGYVAKINIPWPWPWPWWATMSAFSPTHACQSLRPIPSRYVFKIKYPVTVTLIVTGPSFQDRMGVCVVLSRGTQWSGCTSASDRSLNVWDAGRKRVGIGCLFSFVAVIETVSSSCQFCWSRDNSLSWKMKNLNTWWSIANFGERTLIWSSMTVTVWRLGVVTCWHASLGGHSQLLILENEYWSGLGWRSLCENWAWLASWTCHVVTCWHTKLWPHGDRCAAPQCYSASRHGGYYHSTITVTVTVTEYDCTTDCICEIRVVQCHKKKLLKRISNGDEQR